MGAFGGTARPRSQRSSTCANRVLCSRSAPSSDCRAAPASATPARALGRHCGIRRPEQAAPLLRKAARILPPHESERRVRTHGLRAPLLRTAQLGPSKAMGPRDFLPRGELRHGIHRRRPRRGVGDARASAILQVMNPGGCVIFDDVHARTRRGAPRRCRISKSGRLIRCDGHLWRPSGGVYRPRPVDKPSDSKADRPPRRKDTSSYLHWAQEVSAKTEAATAGRWRQWSRS